MKIVTTHCRFCNKTVKLKSHFLVDFEIDNLLNLMLFPHCMKEHRNEMNLKRIFRTGKSLLILLLAFPIHLLFLLVWLLFLPLYLLLDNFY